MEIKLDMKQLQSFRQDLKSDILSNQLSLVTCDCRSYVSSHTVTDLQLRHREGSDYMKLCVQYLSYIYDEKLLI